MVDVTFYGVRGSTPSPCPANGRYGGNTSCVVVQHEGSAPVIFDLGTGLRQYGCDLQRHPDAEPFRGVALVTHLHWDHVQGLPFFAPVLAAGARLDVYGPPPDGGGSLDDAVRTFICPPYFPVDLDVLPGDFSFTDVTDARLELDDYVVNVFPVPHVGVTNGYRVDVCGVSVGYAPDHQQPGSGSFEVAPQVIAGLAGVDLLIHDAQYTPDEFDGKANWGHCTYQYAVEVARQVGARKLALFHHDPTHYDEMLDSILADAMGLAKGEFEVVAAAEGMTITLAAPSTASVVSAA